MLFKSKETKLDSAYFIIYNVIANQILLYHTLYWFSLIKLFLDDSCYSLLFILYTLTLNVLEIWWDH